MNRRVHVLSGAAYDLYIGRTNAYHKLPASKWQNPFKINAPDPRPGYREPLTRAGVVELYRAYLLDSPLRHDILELDGKILACWCEPRQACHGDVLLELLDAALRGVPV